MDLREIQTMRKDVKKKAKKQIDELIEKLKMNEFLKNPKIQNLIDRVQNAQVKVEITSGGEVPNSQKPVKSKTSAKNMSRQLLDLIKTSDVANRIAASVLARAEDLSQKLKTSKPSSKAKKTKKASTAAPKKARKKTTKKTK